MTAFSHIVSFSLSLCFLNFRCIALHHLVGFCLFQESLDSCLGCLVYLAFVLQTFDTLRFFLYSVFNVQCFDCFISHQKPEISFHFLITGNTSSLYKRLSSVISKGIRQPPALPCRLQHSTIGRLSLNLRVRDENGCVP